MTIDHKEELAEIREIISKHPQREEIERLASQLRSSLRKFAEPGLIAFALVGAEMAAVE